MAIAVSFSACSNTTIEKPNKPNVSLTNTYWKANTFYNNKIKVITKQAHIKFTKEEKK